MTTTDTETDLHASGCGTSRPVGRRSLAFEYTMLCVFALTLVSLFEDEVREALGISSTPPEVVSVGTVQGVRYIGDFGYDTQVDTQGESFLVSGIARLARNTPLEIRQRSGTSRLCVVTSQTCWRIRGR